MTLATTRMILSGRSPLSARRMWPVTAVGIGSLTPTIVPRRHMRPVQMRTLHPNWPGAETLTVADVAGTGKLTEVAGRGAILAAVALLGLSLRGPARPQNRHCPGRL